MRNSKLTGQAEVIHLIREDLKCQRFFNGLRALGLNDESNQPELAPVILAQAGFDAASDHHLDRYYRLLYKYAAGPEMDHDTLQQRAVALYEELASLQPPGKEEKPGN